MEKTEVIAGLIVVVAVLVLGAIAMGFFGGIFSENNNVSDNPAGQQSSGNVTPPAPGKIDSDEPSDPVQQEPSPNEDKYWAMITKTVVEKSCLNRAKAAAGSFAWAVSGCTCSADEGAARKYYGCSARAADGDHPASVDCILSEGFCKVSSESGNGNITFEYLVNSAS